MIMLIKDPKLALEIEWETPKLCTQLVKIKPIFHGLESAFS